MDDDEKDGLISVPPPPMGGQNHGFFFVYGEWTQVATEGTIATAENPNPTGQVFKRKIGTNECIAMHPAVYAIMVQQARPGYTVQDWSPITKEMYEWYTSVERMIGAAIQEARKKAAGGA